MCVCVLLFLLVALLSLTAIQCGSIIIHPLGPVPPHLGRVDAINSTPGAQFSAPRICRCARTVGARWAVFVARMQLLPSPRLSSVDLCGGASVRVARHHSGRRRHSAIAECCAMGVRSVLCTQLAPNCVSATNSKKKTVTKPVLLTVCAGPAVRPIDARPLELFAVSFLPPCLRAIKRARSHRRCTWLLRSELSARSADARPKCSSGAST